MITFYSFVRIDIPHSSCLDRNTFFNAISSNCMMEYLVSVLPSKRSQELGSALILVVLCIALVLRTVCQSTVDSIIFSNTTPKGKSRNDWTFLLVRGIIIKTEEDACELAQSLDISSEAKKSLLLRFAR